MNRSLNNRSQIRVLATGDSGRASVRTIETTDFEDATTHVREGIECGCHARRRRPHHEILVSRWRR